MSILDYFGGAHNDNTLDVIVGDLGRYTRCLSSISHIALTVTFTDSNLFKYKEQYLVQQVKQCIKRTRGIVRYCLIKDVSRTGRFHLHGSIQTSNVNAIANLRRKLSQFGITKAKVIDNVDRWTEYCTLQYTEQGKDGVKLKKEDFVGVTSG